MNPGGEQASIWWLETFSRRVTILVCRLIAQSARHAIQWFSRCVSDILTWPRRDVLFALVFVNCATVYVAQADLLSNAVSSHAQYLHSQVTHCCWLRPSITLHTDAWGDTRWQFRSLHQTGSRWTVHVNDIVVAQVKRKERS